MDHSKKDIVNEPSDIYELSHQTENTIEELNPILIQLIEKSKKEHEQGLSFSHEMAMEKIKLRLSL